MSEPDDSGSGGRHAGREVALQVLYALDLGESGPRDARAARAARGEGTHRPALAEPATSAPSPRAAALSRALSSSRGRRVPRLPAAARAGAAYAPQPDRVERVSADEDDEADAKRVLDPIAASGAAFDRIAENFSVPGSAIAFARELVAGVAAKVSELDELVGQHARNWRVSRMAAVDRNVLRLAVYELRETRTPVAVVIDEAVDLARRFGSDTSPSFVNGILDAVAREVRVA